MFVVFLGELFKENKGLFLLRLSSQSGNNAKRLFSAEWRLLQLKGVGLHYPMALLQPHYHLNSNKDNLEVNLSEQSVKECKPSLILMIDSHHQQ